MRINLKIERIKRGFTQEQMAKELGLTQAAYSLYELGKTSPTLDKAKEIANYFDSTIEYIFLNKNTINNSNSVKTN